MRYTLFMLMVFISSATCFSQEKEVSLESLDKRLEELETPKEEKLSKLEQQIKEQEATIDKLDKELEAIKEIQKKWIWIPSVAIAALAIAIAWGGRALARSKIRELITEELANRLNVKTEVLEDALKDLSKDYNARHGRHILVLSAIEGQVADIRSLLLRGGFNPANIHFDSIHNKFDTKNIDVIVFNDMVGSKLTLEEIDNAIGENKFSVKNYFYFGTHNALPMSTWKKNHNINMTGANMHDTLVKNLINALKTYT
jgi:hypothetical protein